jgi:hypothetical protein
VGVKYELSTPPANYTFGSNPADPLAACVAAFSDCTGTVDQSSGNSSSTGDPTPTDVIATGITTTVTCDLVWVGAVDAGSVSQAYTPPTNYTEAVDEWSGAFPSISLAYRENVASGSTGDITGTCTLGSGSAGFMAFLVALETNAGGGGPTWYDHDGVKPWSSLWRSGRV